eukprot:m51a1_g3231 hypothetical protein (606) ;mRNA; r:105047-107163
MELPTPAPSLSPRAGADFVVTAPLSPRLASASVGGRSPSRSESPGTPSDSCDAATCLNRARQQIALLKKAVLAEQQRSRELEARVEEAEEDARNKDIASRDAVERLDAADFNIARLTKEELERRPSSGSSSSSGSGGMGLFRGVSRAEHARVLEQLEVARYELDGKIRENEQLHTRIVDVRDEHKRVLETLEAKLAQTKSAAARREEELAAREREAREAAAQLRDERDASAEALRTLSMELEAARAESAEKDRRTSAVVERLSSELQSLRAEVRERLPFDDRRVAALRRWDASTSDDSAWAREALARSAAYAAGLAEAMPTASVPYDEALRDKQLLAELLERERAASERAERLEAELGAARAERGSLQQQIDSAARSSAREQGASSVSARGSLVLEKSPVSPRGSLSLSPVLQVQPGSPAQQPQQTTGEGRYTMSVVDQNGTTTEGLGVTPEDREREALVKKYYEALLLQCQGQAHKADARATELGKELERLRGSASRSDAELKAALDRAAQLEQQLANAQDDLATANRSTDAQIQILSEHLAGLNDNIRALGDELATVKACRVMCGRCRVWNTVGWLVGDGNYGQVCSKGSHATLSFQGSGASV